MAVFVLYTNHSFASTEGTTGGTKRFLELLFGLLERGNTVHLFSPPHVNISAHVNLILHTINSSNTRYIPQGVGLFIRNYRKIKKNIAHIQYDAFIVMDVPYAVQLALMRIPKTVFMVRQDFVGCRLMSLNNCSNLIIKITSLFFLWAEGITISYSQKIITQSKYDLELLIHRHPRLTRELKSKTCIVPNNINPSWITSQRIEIQDARIAAKKTEQLTICFIGNVNKLKGIEVLLGAMENISKQKYDVNLKVVGDGKQLPELKKKYAIHSNIEFLGYRRDALSILKSTDLLVVPSFYDSFPNTIMEALYVDVPAIGSNRGGIPEILHYQELIFEPTVDELTQKLKNIFDHKLIAEYQKLCLMRKQYFMFDWVKEIEKCLLSKKDM
jgi:glycosyltransferase involved in cell wall biosynthesis